MPCSAVAFLCVLLCTMWQPCSTARCHTAALPHRVVRCGAVPCGCLTASCSAVFVPIGPPTYPQPIPSQSLEGELHAFQLIPADSASAEASIPSAEALTATEPSSRHPEPLILAASSAADKEAWMERLASLFATNEPLPGSQKDMPRMDEAASTLETKLAAASMS